jgi:Ni,Fe-hydrogenase I cytochrome b subunit
MTQMAEHKHGEMNTEVQEKTFEGFIRYTIWGAAVSIGILLFLAIFNS